MGSFLVSNCFCLFLEYTYGLYLARERAYFVARPLRQFLKMQENRVVLAFRRLERTCPAEGCFKPEFITKCKLSNK